MSLFVGLVSNTRKTLYVNAQERSGVSFQETGPRRERDVQRSAAAPANVKLEPAAAAAADTDGTAQRTLSWQPRWA